MTKLAFRTLFGSWTALGERYVDEVELDDASPDLVAAAGAAHAAGVIEVTEGLDTSAVESQEASEAAQEAAMGDWVDAAYEDEYDDEGRLVARRLVAPGHWTGPWHEGNLELWLLEARERHARVAGLLDEGEERTNRAKAHARLGDQITQVEENLAWWRDQYGEAKKK